MQELNEQLETYISQTVPQLPPTEAFFEEPGDPSTLKQMQNMQTHDAYFDRLLNSERCIKIAEATLGEPVVPNGVEYFRKPARIGKATPPHQDGYYFSLVPNPAVTLWLALTAVNEENGCLRYVPGSHRDGVRPHGASSVVGFSQGLLDWSPRDAEREVALILEPGDLLAHHSLIVHRADANTSERPRVALGLVYYGQSAKRDDAAWNRYLASLRDQQIDSGIVQNPKS